MKFDIKLKIANQTGAPQTVHVFDTLSGGTRPVEGSPFALGVDEQSPSFSVKADPKGRGVVAYRCASGIVRAHIEVTDGACVPV